MLAVSILSACFMQEVSGDVPSATPVTEEADTTHLMEGKTQEQTQTEVMADAELAKAFDVALAEAKAFDAQASDEAKEAKAEEEKRSEEEDGDINDNADIEALDTLVANAEQLSVKAKELGEEAAKVGASDEAKKAAAEAEKLSAEAEAQVQAAKKGTRAGGRPQHDPGGRGGERPRRGRRGQRV